VVINEIHYHPGAGGDEFVELENITTNAVPLFDPAQVANTWKVTGIDFMFPTNITLEPNGLLLLVATNPSLFRAKYSVPTNVLVLGPYAGVLQDSGERLELERPDAPDTNGLFYITVDEIRYNDKTPWPPAADGSGASLQRKDSTAYGNDPINWQAASPTPGLSNHPADRDGDGLPDAWEIAHGTNPVRPDADEDPDGDGYTNLQEYLAGTDPQLKDSYLRVEGFRMSNGLFSLQFLAVSNRTYSALYKQSLEAVTWSKLADVEAALTNRTVTLQDPTCCPSNRFYWIVTPSRP
jgi:hypothetical protein